MSIITISPGANIQRAINSAASGDTIVFKPGVYNFSRVVNLKSGVSLQGEPGALLKSNGTVGIFQGLGVRNIKISGFTFDGAKNGPTNSGAIYLDSSSADQSGTPSNNIRILNNTFQNWLNKDSANLWFWHTQNTYVQGNTFKNGNAAVAWSTAEGAPPMDNLVISKNLITGMRWMGIETAFDSTVSNVHIDYNTIKNIGDMSISFVEGEVGGRVLSGTVWGNKIDGANSGGTPVELGNYGGRPFNVTVSQNVLANHEWGMMFSDVPGLAVLNNRFVNIGTPFGEDGGYKRTEWIGVNTVDGVKQNGWIGNGSYGERPALHSPSAPPSGSTSVSAMVANDAQLSPAVGASASSSSDATSGQVSAVAGTTDPRLAPIQPDTLLGKLGATAGFSERPASAARDWAADAASDTQSRHGAGLLAQLAGGSLKADLTNVGSLDKALTAGAPNAGSGARTEAVGGIGAALSSLDQGGKQHDALNPDTWRPHA
ncbi:MAG: hypothetical protein K2Y27_01480 [Xanthobacteraceae bacterium]|nr:hypothetical protein [Xanthobacteraceae bacterium]